MKPLQIRLDAGECDVIAAGLRRAAQLSPPTDMRAEWLRIATWVELRRLTVYGPPEQENPEEQHAICEKCLSRHTSANQPCYICRSPDHCSMQHGSVRDAIPGVVL